jgi:flagellar assembly protein FliH
MEKYRNAEVKSFQFSDLESSHVVSQNQFKPFEFESLTGEPVTSVKVSDDQIRSERNFAAKNNFKIDNIVSDSRGLSRQEQSDLEKGIQHEVNRRLEAAYQEAFNEGLARGLEEGKKEALVEFNSMIGQKVEELTHIIEKVQGQTEKILETNRTEVYEFIKRFTKWILIKEINEKVYLEGLLEKLILEMNARKNLIIKVGKSNFSQMPEVIQNVEGRLGQLSNIRVEIVPEIVYPGIILESENGLIDGSLEGVFRNIDKIFEQIRYDQVSGNE